MTNKISKRLRPDDRGRITLGEIAKSVSSYDLEIQSDGKIVLTPYVEIPKNEMWLHSNKKAFNDVIEGIKQAKNKQVKSLGSFSQFADEEID